MPHVDINGTIVEFPDDLSADELNKAVEEAAGQIPESKEDKPSFLSKALTGMKDDLPEIAGSIVGGIAAAPAAAAVLPFTGPAGAMAVDSMGQGAGAAAGGALKQVYQQVTGSPNAPQTSTDAMKEIGSDFAGGLAGGVLGHGMVKAGEAVLEPLGNALRPTVVAGAKAVKEAFQKFGGKFLPSQLTNGPIGQWVENFVESSLFGSGAVKALKAGQQESLGKMSDAIVDSFTNSLDSTGAEEGGKLALQGLIDGESAFKATAGAMYKNLDEKTGGVVLSSLPLKSLAATATKEFEKAGNISVTQEVKQVLNAVKSLPDDMDFSAVQEFRSQVLSRIRDLKELPGMGAAKDLLNDVVTASNRLIEDTSHGLKGEALGAWKAANKFYREGYEVFNNDLITKLAKKAPEKLGAAIFAKGDVQTVKAVTTALKKSGELTKNPELYDGIYQNLLSGHFDELLKGVTDASTGQINGTALLKTITNPKMSRTLEAMYSPEQMTAIRQFAKVADRVSSYAVRQTKSMSGAMAQAAGVTSAIGALTTDSDHRGKIALGGITVSLLPYALGKIITSQVGVKLLTEGLEYSIGEVGKRSIGAVGNLISFAAKNGLLDEEKAK